MGHFAAADFKRHKEDEKNVGIWKWSDNPFTGTKEIQGLKLMMMLVNNWDTKDVNNKIIGVINKETGKPELRYEVSDLGASFGKTGGPFSHSKNKVNDYVKSQFVLNAKQPTVSFDYHGVQSKLIADVSLIQAACAGAIKETWARKACGATETNLSLVEKL